MAKTYAVVEFESTRECAVVPVLWIVQNGTQCYWPRTKTEEAFHKLLAEVAPYQKSWQLFPVRRVLYTNDDLQAAENRLTDALDNGTSEEGCKDITSVTRKKMIDEGNFSSQRHSASPPSQTRKYDKNRENSSPTEKPSPTASKTKNNDNKNSSSEEESSQVPKRKKKHHKNKANSSSEEESSPVPKRKKKHHKNKENSFSEEESSLSSKRKRKDHKKKDNHKKDSKRSKHKNRSETSESGSTSSVMNVSEPEDRIIPNGGPSTPTQTSSSVERPMSGGHKDAVAGSGAQYQRSITGMPSTPKSTNVNKRIQSDDTTSTISRPSLEANQRDTNGSLTTPRSQFVPLPNGVFQEKVIRYFGRVTAEQEENTNMLSQILIYVQASSTSTAKPQNMPELPLKDMLSFEDLDTRLLRDEAYSAYLKNRLAAIGGLNQRQSVMSMMRFLLSNELAMRFNWAGQHQKRSFKQTTMKDVIFEAAKVMFKGKHSSDKFIVSAIQDWLKLAKNRHDYKTSSKTTPSVTTR